MTVGHEQVPGVQRRRVGEVVVTAINDGSLLVPMEVVQGIDEAERDRLYHAAGRRPPFASAVNAFLLQWPGRTVLVDAGMGTQGRPALGKLPANLRASGAAPGEVDTLLMTHLHSDHVGGLLDEAGAPLFPNATVMVPELEMAFWLDDAAREAVPESWRGSFDLARRATAAYGGRLHRFTDPAVAPGVTALPLPGHTPGHTGYEVRSGGESLVIWGDIVHLPEVQCARPDVTVAFDSDPAAAIASRRMLLERAVKEDLLITGMHLSFPGFCRIARAGEGYAVQPQAWQYSLDPS